MFRSKRFRNNWILILTISSIPGLIFGGLIYWLAGDRLENELLQTHNKQIQLRAASIDEQLSYLETSVVHWAFDPTFSYSLANLKLSRDFEIGRNVSRTLNIMLGSIPLAKSTELYLEGPVPVRFHPEYEKLADTALIGSYRQLLAQNNSVFWTQQTSVFGSLDLNGISLVTRIPGADPNPYGIIQVRLDLAKVTNLLQTMSPYHEGGSFMIEKNSGRLLASSAGPDSPELQEVLKNAVQAKKNRSGSFLFDWKHATYTVSFGTMTRINTDWVYISASPISVITKPVVFISKLILTLSFASLLLAFVLSWVASRKIYSPIARLVQLLTGNTPAADGKEPNDDFKLIEKEWLYLTRESITLQNKLEQQLPHLKEGFLLQLVRGYLYAYSEKDLLERMRNFGWAVDERNYVVLFVQMHGFENLEGRFSQGDEGLVTFAAANIASELASGRFEQAEVMNFHDLSVGLLIMVPQDESAREEIRIFCQELTQAIQQVLKMYVSVTIGSPALSVIQVPSRFEEVMQASNRRRFESRHQTIDLESPDDFTKEESEIPYPFALEREIIQAIRTGQQEEAKRLAQSFLEALLERGAKVIDVQQDMLQLLGSILHAVRHSGMDSGRILDSANLYEQLLQLGEPQKMLVWLLDKVVSPFIQELESRSDVQVKKTVESAMIYLQNNYMKDISLDSCADYTGTNSVALSKAFKQVTGKNFIDYITELRIGKAKELLRDTDMKMGDVAERAGYQPSYFNRIFKKQEGVTPSQYREFCRK